MTIFLGMLTLLSLFCVVDNTVSDWRRLAIASLLSLGLATLMFLSWMARSGML